jgi:hypothetical protein
MGRTHKSTRLAIASGGSPVRLRRSSASQKTLSAKGIASLNRMDGMYAYVLTENAGHTARKVVTLVQEVNTACECC